MSLELKNVAKSRRRGRAYPSATPAWCSQDGTFNILLGPTLAGKTTLMQLMAGLDTPTHGETSGSAAQNVHRRAGAEAQRRRWSISSSSTTRHLSVYENIASPLRVQGMPKAEIESQGRRGRVAAAPRPRC